MKKTDSIVTLLKALIILVSLLSLAACGGKTVTTQDDSADYQNARALPPLKKPSRVAYKTPAPVSETAPIVIAGSQPSGNVESDLVDATSDQTASLVQEPGLVEPATINAPSLSSEFQAQIISVNDNVKRLSIDAEAKPAWQYLVEKLGQSDLTIHARNEKAGRFSIGCTGIDAGESVVKRGGWSIFTRKVERQSEYCTLLVTSSRAKTIVKVLDRSGLEASAESSDGIFARLL